MKFNDITAVILAGGKNSRIQKEKAMIFLNGAHVIDHELRVISEIFSHIMLVTEKDQLKKHLPHLPVTADIYKNCGPLGGIHAAMKTAITPAVFVFACDMPALNPDLICRQIQLFRDSRADIVVPRHREGIEPLHAIYSINNLPHLQQNLNKGKFSVRSFYNSSHVSYMDVEQKDAGAFFNINTMNDLQIYA